jgi:N-hydroxyarylamine O-acetyltransferase
MRPSELDAYLARIGHRDTPAPDLATLAALQFAHATAIPFENLDPWLGREVALDLDALQRKLVAGGRGGFCYEHNLLLGAALRAIGYRVTDLAARVRWNVAPGVVRARTHMLLRVDLDGVAWLVDAGFGGRTLTAPLRLAERGAQQTPHGRFRLCERDGTHLLEVEGTDAWHAVYAFDLQAQLLADYELTSWYLCRHPESVFRLALVAARPVADGRWTLRDRTLTFHANDGRSETTLLADTVALRTALADRFGIRLAGLAELDARLAALPVPAAA